MCWIEGSLSVLPIQPIGDLCYIIFNIKFPSVSCFFDIQQTDGEGCRLMHSNFSWTLPGRKAHHHGLISLPVFSCLYTLNFKASWKKIIDSKKKNI